MNTSPTVNIATESGNSNTAFHRVKDRSNVYRMPNIRPQPDKILRHQQNDASNRKHHTD
jgi:hypothetical protein